MHCVSNTPYITEDSEWAPYALVLVVLVSNKKRCQLLTTFSVIIATPKENLIIQVPQNLTSTESTTTLVSPSTDSVTPVSIPLSSHPLLSLLHLLIAVPLILKPHQRQREAF